MLALGLRSVIRRFGKRCDDLIAFPDCIPAAMVEVQMSVDNDVNVFGSDASRPQFVEQPCSLTMNFDHALGEFVPHSSLDQDIVITSANEERVQSGSDEV